jgi:hypothetical protein
MCGQHEHQAGELDHPPVVPVALEVINPRSTNCRTAPDGVEGSGQ